MWTGKFDRLRYRFIVEMYDKSSIKYLPVLALLAGFFYFRTFALRWYWFGDELQLVKDILEFGLWKSVFFPFAEGVVPLFKILWGLLALLSRGEYFPMVCATWFVHVLNIVLFISTLERARFSPTALLVAALSAATAWSNIDLLTISYHLNSGLSCTFYLCMLRTLLCIQDAGRASNGHLVWYGIFSLAAALTFQRAFAFGVGLFAFIYLSKLSRRKSLAVLTGTPLAFELFLSIYFGSGIENRGEILRSMNLLRVAQYAGHFYAGNPLFHLLHMPRRLADNTFSLSALFVLKLSIIAVALIGEREGAKEKYRILVSLLCYDVAHTALIGVGRYAEPLSSALAFRYQFASLLAFTPFLGCAFEGLRQRLSYPSERFKRLSTALAIILLFVWITLPWRTNLRAHAFWQGKQARRILDAPSGATLSEQDIRWNGVPPTMSLDDARDALRKLKN